MIRRKDQQAVRCAIYTRVSTLGQAAGDFSSLDNQRESAEAYVRSQSEAGWSVLPALYDDAGWTGSNVERPALQRLIADAEGGRVDIVVVYKIDRLSRSLLDFAQLMDRLEKAGAGLVSVTQQFDTSNSMGKLTLNMLLSFAQFEREMIAERTRDKVLAARRRGKWTGGLVPLGYDLVDGKLVVNEDEAPRLRQIFELYIEHSTITATLAEIRERRWRSKAWMTKSGIFHEGRPFAVDSLRRLLTSPYPAGRLSVGDDVVEGEHRAIVEVETWEEVQRLIASNGRDGGKTNRNQSGALLKGLLRCGHCGTAMTPTSTKKGTKRYRFYVCVSAQKHGWSTCPSKSIAARTVEGAVIDQIKAIARDPALIDATVQAAIDEHERQRAQREAETRALSAEFSRLAQEEGRLAAATTRGGHAASAAEGRLTEIAGRKEELQLRIECLREKEAEDSPPDTEQLRRTLESFDPVWAALEPIERTNLARLLIAEVVYDGETEELEIALRIPPTDSNEEAA